MPAPSYPYPTDQYEPTRPELWRDVLEVATGRRRELRIGDRTIHSPNEGQGFDNMPHNPNGIAWAVKQYNGFMGGWRKKEATMPDTDTSDNPIKQPEFTVFQRQSLQRMGLGGVVVTDHFETHCQMQELQAQRLVMGSAGKKPGQYFWSLTEAGQRRVTAALGEDLKSRVETLMQASDEDAKKMSRDLAKWFGENFQRVRSAKTPRGQKRVKEEAQRLLDVLELMGNPGGRVTPGGTQSVVKQVWDRLEPDLGNLVKFFTSEGDLSRGKQEAVTELKLSHATYQNRANISEANFRKYAEAVDKVFGSLKGWRKKALAGNLKVAFVGRGEMKPQGKYVRAKDEMLVRATPQVLKRSAGYGSLEYILIHELGHRYEEKNKLPTDFDRDVTWRTTRYSWTEGEAFAELFALSQFKLTGNWDAKKVEKFEDLMSGKTKAAAFRVLQRYQQREA
jgi:hypothetical protein